jgi:hypothetical protein
MTFVAKLKTFVIISMMVFVASCKSKPADIIVKKWKSSAITMEFKKDGTYEAVGKEVERGTWVLSEDGKTLTGKVNGKDKEQKLEIKELTKEKLVITKGGEDLIFTPA